MLNKTHSILAILAIAPCSLFGQYQSFTNAAFEGMDTLPPDFKHGHYSTAITTRVVPYVETPLSPEGTAAAILGLRGLEFLPSSNNPHLSLTYDVRLRRERLGSTGAALFEADFYLAEEGEELPTIAILAAAADKPENSYHFYRFGIDRTRLFFSFTDGEPQPKIYEQQNLEDLQLSRPGWHRLQLLISGQNQIYCAIDGKPTSFSPIQDSTLTVLNPGLMVTQGKSNGVPAYTDNLGIKWTRNSNAPLPPSPWTSIGDTSIEWEALGINWAANSADAWTTSKQTNRPILALIHDHNASSNEYLAELLQSQEVQQTASNHVMLRIDMETSDGRNIANRFGVSAAPAFVFINQSGKATASSRLLRGQTNWQSVKSELGI